MSVSLGDAILYLRGDRRPLTQEMNAAERETRGWAQNLGNQMKGAIGGAFKGAAIAAAGGITALGAGLGAAALDGLRFNSSLENVEAQLTAFTKDAALAKQIIADVRLEAEATPFAFEEMAAATAGLLPAAKQAGTGYMELLKLAEILAASNPAEGLEGAAFSLREAVSGDYTSIIERFNLPRQYINKLKEEGVPALEVVRRAMLEMGYDATLVANLAGTMTGRWSTFVDTLRSYPQRATAKLFDSLKGGLEGVQGLLDDNAEALGEWSDRIGEALGRRATSAVESLTHRVRVFQAVTQAGGGTGAGILAALGMEPRRITQLLDATGRLQRGLGGMFDGFRAFLSGAPGDFPWEDILPPWLAARMYDVSAIFESLPSRVQLLRDSFTTFRQSFAGNWEDDAIIHPLHRVVGRLGTFVGEVWTKAQEVRAAFGEDGWRGALRQIVPPAWSSLIEAIIGEMDRVRAAAWDKLVEIRQALGENGWRGALREMIPAGWADRIEGAIEKLDELREAAARYAEEELPDKLRELGKVLVEVAENEGEAGEKGNLLADAIAGLGLAFGTSAIISLFAKLAGRIDVARAALARIAVALGLVNIPMLALMATVTLLTIAWRNNWRESENVMERFLGNFADFVYGITFDLGTTLPRVLNTFRGMWQLVWRGVGDDLMYYWEYWIKPVLGFIAMGISSLPGIGALDQGLPQLPQGSGINDPGTRGGGSIGGSSSPRRLNIPQGALSTNSVTVNLAAQVTNTADERRLADRVANEVEQRLSDRAQRALRGSVRRPIGTQHIP